MLDFVLSFLHFSLQFEPVTWDWDVFKFLKIEQKSSLSFDRGEGNLCRIKYPALSAFSDIMRVWRTVHLKYFETLPDTRWRHSVIFPEIHVKLLFVTFLGWANFERTFI